MKRNGMSGLLCVLMSVALLGGCGIFSGDFDASGYVKASLDMSYRGEIDQYIELTEATEEQALEMYEEIVSSNYAAITAGMVMTDEQEAEFEELCRQHLANITYTVNEAEKVSSSEYSVAVAAKKLVSIEAEGGTLEAYNEELMVRAEEGEFNDMEEDEFMALCTTEILDIYRDYVKNPEYDEETAVTVRVVKDSSENVFYIQEEDVAVLEAALY